MFVLDTNILSAMRFDPDILRSNEVCTTAINIWEIERGAALRLTAADLRSFATFVCENIPVVPFDDEAARYFAGLKRGLNADAMIASIAVTQDMTLVTRNVTDFTKFRQLRVEKW